MSGDCDICGSYDHVESYHQGKTMTQNPTPFDLLGFIDELEADNNRRRLLRWLMDEKADEGLKSLEVIDLLDRELIPYRLTKRYSPLC